VIEDNGQTKIDGRLSHSMKGAGVSSKSELAVLWWFEFVISGAVDMPWELAVEQLLTSVVQGPRCTRQPKHPRLKITSLSHHPHLLHRTQYRV
jgi:hypothetical protein